MLMKYRPAGRGLTAVGCGATVWATPTHLGSVCFLIAIRKQAEVHLYMPSIRELPSFLFVLVFTLGLIACTAAPVQEMSDARQAIQAAHAAGADTLAHDQFSQARALLEQAEQELESGHYRKARRNAMAARSHAMSAREHAEQTHPAAVEGM